MGRIKKDDLYIDLQNEINSIETNISSINTQLVDKAKKSTNESTALKGQVVTANGDGTFTFKDNASVDNGRYQSDFGLDNATLINCSLINSVLTLDYETVTSQLIASSYIGLYSNNGYGEKLSTAFTANIDGINYIDVPIIVSGTPSVPLRCTIYDKTTSTLLATISVPLASIVNNAFNRINVNTAIVAEHEIHIRFDMNGPGDVSNCYTIGYNMNVTVANANMIASGSVPSWSGVADVSTTYNLAFKLSTYTRKTTGTVTKTVTPLDLKKWGNIKWVQTTSAVGSTVTCNVYKSDGTTLLLSNITSMSDLSNIDVIANPTISIKWTLTRVNAIDTSPTISNISATWEGKLINSLSGTYSDTTTIIPNGGTYAKTIPLGFNAKVGTILLRGAGSVSSCTNWAKIDFTNVQNNSHSIAPSGSMLAFSKTIDGLLSAAKFDSGSANIRIDDCYISGNNLIIVFRNVSASVAALNISSSLWEVWG